jgi:hypothetical protein
VAYKTAKWSPSASSVDAKFNGSNKQSTPKVPATPVKPKAEYAKTESIRNKPKANSTASKPGKAVGTLLVRKVD